MTWVVQSEIPVIREIRGQRFLPFVLVVEFRSNPAAFCRLLPPPASMQKCVSPNKDVGPAGTAGSIPPFAGCAVLGWGLDSDTQQVGAWDLELLWNFELGSWNFPLGHLHLLAPSCTNLHQLAEKKIAAEGKQSL